MSDGSKKSRASQFHTEAHYTEKWQDRFGRNKPKPINQPSNLTKGRPRSEIVWSPEKKALFTRLWNDGAIAKVIMHECGIGSKSAVTNAAKRLGLRTRLRRRGERYELKVRLEEYELEHIRRRSAEMGTTMSKYVIRLIKIDKG